MLIIKKKMMKKIKVVWSLIKFTVASGVKILTDSMKKEAQTYNEEREQQKKMRKNEPIV